MLTSLCTERMFDQALQEAVDLNEHINHAADGPNEVLTNMVRLHGKVYVRTQYVAADGSTVTICTVTRP